jgi:hypothetical protein
VGLVYNPRGLSEVMTARPGVAGVLQQYFLNHLNHMVQEGTFVRETLALQVWTVCSGIRTKA